MKSIKTFFKTVGESFMSIEPMWLVVIGALTNQESLILVGIALLLTEKRN